MTNIVLLGERIAYRSFSGANKALPVLASSLANAGFKNVTQLDLEQPGVSIADAARAGATADLVVVGGAMSPQWAEPDAEYAP